MRRRRAWRTKAMVEQERCLTALREWLDDNTDSEAAGELGDVTRRLFGALEEYDRHLEPGKVARLTPNLELLRRVVNSTGELHAVLASELDRIDRKLMEIDRKCDELLAEVKEYPTGDDAGGRRQKPA